MDGIAVTVKTLGEGPHWDINQEGAVISIDGNSIDLDEIQIDQPSHYDFMCSVTGRYQATVILPPSDYLPVFDEEVEPQPERLPIDLTCVEVRVYPRFDREEPTP